MKRMIITRVGYADSKKLYEVSVRDSQIPELERLFYKLFNKCRDDSQDFKIDYSEDIFIDNAINTTLNFGISVVLWELTDGIKVDLNKLKITENYSGEPYISVTHPNNVGRNTAILECSMLDFISLMDKGQCILDLEIFNMLKSLNLTQQQILDYYLAM